MCPCRCCSSRSYVSPIASGFQGSRVRCWLVRGKVVCAKATPEKAITAYAPTISRTTVIPSVLTRNLGRAEVRRLPEIPREYPRDDRGLERRVIARDREVLPA